MQEFGIPAADIKKLKEGGVNTVDYLAHATKKELCAIKGLSEAKVAKLQTEGDVLYTPNHCFLPAELCLSPCAACSLEGHTHGVHHRSSDPGAER